MNFIRQLPGMLWYNREAVIWLLALVLLGIDNPGEHHYTLCPFHHAGWTFCPGCGLGRAITLFFHDEMRESFLMHPMGIPAVALLAYRSVRLIMRPENRKFLTKKHSYG